MNPHACDAPADPPANVEAARRNPHYERLGGRVAVERLVAAFYDAMDTLPEARAIRAMHGTNLDHARHVLVVYLCEWLGGPKAYTAARGAPRLRRAHQAFAIDAQARDAWMACMRRALASACADDALRAELDAAFYKVADFIRNADPGGAARPHPGRPREHAPGAPASPHASSH